jgi:hypothetical protein
MNLSTVLIQYRSFGLWFIFFVGGHCVGSEWTISEWTQGSMRGKDKSKTFDQP